MSTRPISLSGEPVVAGLRDPINPRPSLWQRMVYDQTDNFTDSLFNICRLQKTDEMHGLSKAAAQFFNIGAATLNPFAAVELWKQAFTTGKFL